jgi:hypothetical protein
MKKLTLAFAIIVQLSSLTAHAENPIVVGVGKLQNNLWTTTNGRLSCWDIHDPAIDDVKATLIEATKNAADKDAQQKCEQLGLASATRVEAYSTAERCFNFGFLLSVITNAKYECL